MSKNNPRCDVHMYPKKPNVEFLFLWLQLLGGVVCFYPISLEARKGVDNATWRRWTYKEESTRRISVTNKGKTTCTSISSDGPQWQEVVNDMAKQLLVMERGAFTNGDLDAMAK
jgi:hypothetical protein